MIYSGFAQIYDKFMEMPYETWADYIQAIWRRFDCNPKLVLDMACGTGGLTIPLARRGYEMIGTDVSAEMLAIARQKDNSGTLFLQQDMRELDLFGTVDAIICACDGINYLTEPSDLAAVFALCANYLNPGGLFIFDINTEYKFSTILADNTFAASDCDAAYIWENFYDPADKINEYALTCFVQEREGNTYRRFDETHFQRAYGADEISTALAAANLHLLAQFAELSFESPKSDAQRIFFVAQSGKIT